MLKHAGTKYEWFLFGLIYFVIALILLRTKIALTPAWLDGTLLSNHQQLLDFTYTNNEQSRLLQFFFPETLHHMMGITLADAYLVQRWGFVFLTLLCFHGYLRKWYEPLESFAGVAFLAAVIPLTYMNHLQESAPLLSLIFLLGLWALREKKDYIFMVLMLIGALNNETILSLTAAYILVRCPRWNVQAIAKTSGRAVFFSAPAWIATGIIRFVTRLNPHLGDPFTLGKNLWGMIYVFIKNPLHLYKTGYAYPFLIFGVFWIYAFLHLKEKDPFLCRLAFFIPLFIIPHLMTGLFYEARQMLPLAFILIPMSMQFLRSACETETQKEIQGSD